MDKSKSYPHHPSHKEGGVSGESTVTIRDVLKKYLSTMLLSTMVLAVAIALTAIEEWMKQHAIASWQVLIMQFLATSCFVLDAMVILTASLVITARVISDLFKEFRGREASTRKP